MYQCALLNKIATAPENWWKFCTVLRSAWYDLHTYNLLPMPLKCTFSQYISLIPKSCGRREKRPGINCLCMCDHFLNISISIKLWAHLMWCRAGHIASSQHVKVVGGKGVLILSTLPHPQFQIVCSCYYVVQNMHVMQVSETVNTPPNFPSNLIKNCEGSTEPRKEST